MEKVTKASRIVVEEIPSNSKSKAVEPVVEPKAEPEIKKVSPPLSANFLWIVIPGMILLGLLIGGIIAYCTGIQKLSSNNNTSAITNTPPPEITPSPTPIATPSLSKYKIKILNGSGIKGEAGKVQVLLEKAGFTIESTGNASKYDYSNTIIQSKEGVDKAFLVQLEKGLSTTYKLDKNVVLKDTETSSVIIIVGSSKQN